MPVHNRVLLKLSGEALLGQKDFGVDIELVKSIANEIKPALESGTQTALVIGGGNLFRGIEGAGKDGTNRSVADAMGMLATVMNGLALKDIFEKNGIATELLAAFQVGNHIDNFQRDRAIHAMESGRLLILPGGTGNPYFSTDSAAVLRALETECSAILKGTKVDGVYSADPNKDPNAIFYEKLSYGKVLKDELKVMDLSAFTMARDNGIAIRVFNMTKDGNIKKALSGEEIGTLVS